MIYDCIIIGAGPAGLMAGCQIQDKKTLILEGEAKAAQKLLLSGGGQCNFTHAGDIRDFFCRYGVQEKFVRKTLSQFTNTDAIQFFNRHGMLTSVREDGKVFPTSMDAWDVFRVLRDTAKDCGSEIVTEAKVLSVKRNEKGFELGTTRGIYYAKALILAAGGASYPMTGSDGSGAKLALSLGHTLTEVRPALTPVYVENFPLKNIAGTVYEKGKLLHMREGRKIGAYTGDVLVTHMGLSGPCILDNSRYMQAGDTLRLNMLSEGFDADALEAKLLNGNKKLVKTVLAECMTKRNAQLLTDLAQGMSNDTTCAELGKLARKWLVQQAGGFELKISRLGDLKSAMATAGGVNTKEITPGKMASKSVRGLFFAGEVVDVDGDTGGYNIQWAFSSGYVAAKSVLSFLEEV